MVSKTFHGTFNTVSKVTGTLQRGLDYLTFDADHIKQKERKQAPKGVGEGLRRGGEAVISGFIDGASGLITQPVKGIKKEGGLGFVKGLGKGLIGIPMKPVGGLFEGVTSVTAGISNTSKGEQATTRLRFPRKFSDDGAVITYDREQSLAYDIFRTADNGKYANTEKENEPVACMINHDRAHVYLLTRNSLFKVSISTRVTQWKYDLLSLKEIKRDFNTGIITCVFAAVDMFNRNTIDRKELRTKDGKQACDLFAKRMEECKKKVDLR